MITKNKKTQEEKNDAESKDLLTNAENRNPGDQKWCPPILMPNPHTGFARVDGPGGPVGDPPTHLDTSSVSEGTL